jgi:hypothetical protein
MGGRRGWRMSLFKWQQNREVFFTKSWSMVYLNVWAKPNGNVGKPDDAGGVAREPDVLCLVEVFRNVSTTREQTSSENRNQPAQPRGICEHVNSFSQPGCENKFTAFFAFDRRCSWNVPNSFLQCTIFDALCTNCTYMCSIYNPH